MASRAVNKLAGSIAKIEKLLPPSFHSLGYTFAFNSMVKLAGTAGIRVEQMSGSKAVVSLKNKFRVQNHIGGIHACGMALVGESATGIVVGMNVPDNAIPLCKSMNIKFVKRCEGNIRAEAMLTEEQIKKIHTEEKGDVLVNCKVTDESGKEPIQIEMVWAWVPKVRKAKAVEGGKPGDAATAAGQPPK